MKKKEQTDIWLSMTDTERKNKSRNIQIISIAEHLEGEEHSIEKAMLMLTLLSKSKERELRDNVLNNNSEKDYIGREAEEIINYYKTSKNQCNNTETNKQ